MVKEQDPKLLYWGVIPKCPFYTSAINKGLLVALTILGTVGLYFLNLWVAIGFGIYAIFFYLWLNPVKVCPHCYYNITETSMENGKKIVKLLSKDKWTETCLQNHIKCGKKWALSFIILQIGPIILIIISFFVNWNIMALLFLIGYITVMIIWSIHLKRKVCPTCVIQEECHTAF